MPIVRQPISFPKWQTPETMIKEFIDKYELLLEGEPNQIIYGWLFPYTSPDSVFVYRVDESFWLYQQGDYQKVFPYKIGTIVPFFGTPGVRGQSNVAFFANPEARPWALCDGQRYNNVQTPDLRGRGFIGFDTSDSGADDCTFQQQKGCMKGSITQTGNYAGADFLGLKEIHLPPHVHFYRSPEDIVVGGQNVLQYWDCCCQRVCSGGITPKCRWQGCWRDYAQSNTAPNKITTSRLSASLTNDGWQPRTYLNGQILTTAVSGPHPNLPPYMVLNWKMFIGY